MIPTLGRLVLFTCDSLNATEWNRRNDGQIIKPGDQLPAMVVKVWTPQVVDLRVFRSAATDGWVASVGEGTGDRNWSWPQRQPEVEVPVDPQQPLPTTLDPEPATNRSRPRR
jgi:hypothetical protein